MVLLVWCFFAFLLLAPPAVADAVYLQIVPDPSSAVVGHNVTLSCMFGESYDAKNDVILWEFRTDSKRITVWGSVPGTDKLSEQDQHFQGRTEVEFKQEKASLTLQNIRLSDSGEYRCLIFGNEESSKNLSSKFVALSISAVYLEIVPDSSSAVVGLDVTLNCMFGQSFDAKNNVILWEFRTDKKHITVWRSIPGTDKLRDQDRHFQGRTEVEFKHEKASLTLQNISLSDSGDYRCHVIGNEGSPKYLSSNFVTLSVSVQPEAGRGQTRKRITLAVVVLAALAMLIIVLVVYKRKRTRDRFNSPNEISAPLQNGQQLHSGAESTHPQAENHSLLNEDRNGDLERTQTTAQ